MIYSINMLIDYPLSDQREVVRWWDETVGVSHGAGRGKKNGDPGSFSMADAEAETGILPPIYGTTR